MKLAFLSFCCLFTLFSNGQEVKPTTWQVKYAREKVAKNDTVTIWFIGKIPEHQSIYGTTYYCETGPLPSKLKFTNKGNDYLVLDSAISVGDIPEYDPIFECSMRKFKNVAIIKQVIRMSNPNVIVKGELEYQTCTDNMCIQYNLLFETQGTKVLKVGYAK